MYTIKLKNKNFEGKDELTNKEYFDLPHNLRQYYKKVEDEDDCLDDSSDYETDMNKQYYHED